MERIGVRKIENLQATAWKPDMKSVLLALVPPLAIVGAAVGTIAAVVGGVIWSNSWPYGGGFVQALVTPFGWIWGY